jgi:hypothetical protein
MATSTAAASTHGHQVVPLSPDAGALVTGCASVGGLVAAAVVCASVVADVVAGGRVVRSGLVTGSVVAVDPSVAGGRVVGLPVDVTTDGNVTDPPPEPPHAMADKATATPSAATRFQTIPHLRRLGSRAVRNRARGVGTRRLVFAVGVFVVAACTPHHVAVTHPCPAVSSRGAPQLARIGLTPRTLKAHIACH